MSSSRDLEFDLARYPLVLLRVGSTYSSADWNQMLLDLIALIQRGPFGVMADLRNAQMPNASQRLSFIEMYENHDQLTRAHFLALGAVGNSTIINRVITALNWLRPAPHPVKVFTKMDEAESWVLDQLPEPLRRRVPSAKMRPKG